MDSTQVAVRNVTVRLITDKPVRKTPYQVKGVFIKDFPGEEVVPMLDGRYRDRFLYPRVQVKILNEQIYLVGLNEGVDPILSLLDKLEQMDFGNITFQVLDADVDQADDKFPPINRLIRYRFITPWVALNQTTGGRYRYLRSAEERVRFLNRLLGQNIVFLAREMGMALEDNMFTKVTLNSLFPKPVDESGWGAFSGEFRTNFVLPNYIGLGNGITRGYGAIFGLFNPELFTFNEEEMEKVGEPVPEIENKAMESDVEAVNFDLVPKPKRRKVVKKPRPKKPRKVLSEEFEIEEDEFLSRSNDKPPKKKSRGRPPTKKPSKNENSFNTEEFHKKRHNL